MNLKVHQQGGPCPAYAHEGDAGLDLRSAEAASIPAGGRRLLHTGTHVRLPEGTVGLVFPRSGLGSRGVTLRNAVGVVDSGYRGTIRAALWNTTDCPFVVRKGDRVAQLVVVPYVRCEVEQVGSAEELGDTERGADGHGSTGVA